MTDLHDLLKESIIREDIRDPDDRARIYSEARRAVMRRLWDQDPPIRMEEIDDRIADYDSSIAVIERDIRAHFATAEAEGDVAVAAEIPIRRQAGIQAPLRSAADRGNGARALARQVPIDEDLAPETAPFEMDDARDLPPGSEWGEQEDDVSPDHDQASPDYYDDESGYAAREDDVGTMAEDDDEEEYYDPPAMRPPRRAETEAYDAPLGYDDPDELDEASYRAPVQADRWSEPVGQAVAARTVEARPTRKPRRRKPKKRGSLQVRLLVAAIMVMLAGLGGFAWLLLAPGEAAPERTVTVAIEDRRQVSDAATAIRVAGEEVAVQQTFTVFDGFDPTVFETSADNPVRFDNDGSSGFARVSSSSGSAGARVVIGPGLAERLAGREIRVRISVRESTDRGAGSMRFAYQSGVAISHWQTATLERTYNEVGIRWRVPGIRTNLGGDYLVIEPGIPGDGTGVDIRSVEIDLLAPGAS